MSASSGKKEIDNFHASEDALASEEMEIYVLGVMPRGGSNDIVFVSVVNEISPKTDQSASLLKELANQKRGIVIWRPGGGK
jgi:hypothetical protein